MNLSQTVQLLFSDTRFASKSIQISSFTLLSGYRNTHVYAKCNHNPTCVISIRDTLILMMSYTIRSITTFKSRKIFNEASNNQRPFCFRNKIVSFNDRFTLSWKRGKKYQLKTRHIPKASSGISHLSIVFLVFYEDPLGPRGPFRSLFWWERESGWCRILKRSKRRNLAAYLSKV